MSLVGNFTVNGDREATHNGVASSDVMQRRPSQVGANGGSDSDASTITANADGSRSRRSTNERTDPKASTLTTNQNSEAASADDDSIARREEEVHQLARRYTSQSHYSSTNQNPFDAEPGSSLDPNGEHFNARAWCKAMMHLQTSDEKAHPVRTAGVSFSNLNVHGFGTDTDYQKTVGNIWLQGLGVARTLMGNKGRKIDILQNLDGLVEAGEMLVVLGPPGSGCSTFLKTISGETHGFFVDEKSDINYQGAYINATKATFHANHEQASVQRTWLRSSGERPSTQLRSTFTSLCLLLGKPSILLPELELHAIFPVGFRNISTPSICAMSSWPFLVLAILSTPRLVTTSSVVFLVASASVLVSPRQL